MNILDKIVKTKYEELEKYTKDYVKQLEKKAEERKSVKDFKNALLQDKINIIAEIKKASPSKGVIRKDFNPVEIAKIYEENGAAAISVLADEKYFQGHIDYVEAVSKVVSIPVMRKDFIIDERQVLEAYAKGADSYLLITRILEPKKLRQLMEFGRQLNIEPLVEVFTEEEAKITIDEGGKIVGVNNRDLNTFKVDINKSKNLCPKIKEWGAEIVVAESGISSKKEIDELRNYGVNAFLIGESLMREKDIGKKLKEFIE
ncbi:indole-3-glycerol phosphate synthase TrpC [Hydrogenivirga sp. 128-5-R1-1]|uniref:indole-3-glycerol phosphate synthase TrpC n=1 Tax=Hydrogenivirga sp. 128-5-R1-1 TaxID=392423 RepID=UPI00015F0F24|nr:indole-3-glycerol phosphate synthase TrpC [Hydrogenivirga sp. 128-5-R1-1]EDP73038.1 indole-3-glycerol phosphate synthase [Hydrogenivirga sp. 128-5-R1-1]